MVTVLTIMGVGTEVWGAIHEKDPRSDCLVDAIDVEVAVPVRVFKEVLEVTNPRGFETSKVEGLPL